MLAINLVLCREHYPPLLSAAQSKERAPARDYATASALPADPVRPALRTVACDGNGPSFSRHMGTWHSLLLELPAGPPVTVSQTPNGLWLYFGPNFA
jgi:hypothetical protein